MKTLILAAAAAMLMLGAGSALAATHEVTQKNKKFSVAELTVKKGDVVRFVNEDTFTHNVYSVSPGMEFDIKTQAPGKFTDITFEKAGVAEVRCAIHPTMKMKVTVTD